MEDFPYQLLNNNFLIYTEKLGTLGNFTVAWLKKKSFAVICKASFYVLFIISFSNVLSLGLRDIYVIITKAFGLPKLGLFSNYKVMLLLCHPTVNWIQNVTIGIVTCYCTCFLLVVVSHARNIYCVKMPENNIYVIRAPMYRAQYVYLIALTGSYCNGQWITGLGAAACYCLYYIYHTSVQVVESHRSVRITFRFCDL